MRRYRLTPLALLSIAVLPVTMAAGPHAAAPADLQFSWGALAATGPRATTRYQAVTTDVLSMHAGDRIQFYVAAITRCHLYLLHADPAGDLEEIFPAGESAALAPGAQRYLPGRDDWFVVEGQPGREMVFVLASAEPLSELERLMAIHRSASGSGRKATAAAVLKEIGRLRKAHSPPPSRASRPVPIAGTFRASAPDVASLAATVSAPSFHARTYILDHQ